MNQSTMNFLFKALGTEEATREIQKIVNAAKKAQMSVDAFTKTSAGSQKLIAAQTRAAAAMAEKRVQKQAATEARQAASTAKVAEATDNASKSQKNFFKHIARTTVQSAFVNKLFLEMVDVAGQAVKQVDLMKNFPNTMKSMGVSTADASVSFQKLQQYVGAVGGNLGDATSYVTRFVGATNDVKAATAIFVGLNNALIAGDSSIEEQRQAMIQFAQALERGKPDMREWRTLTQNMSFQLTQVAKAMGYVNANDLGTALTTGKESMARFTTELTTLATGTGPIAQQAMARMTGMQFAFNVMKNTMVQGVAAILNAFGRANIASFFIFLTQVIQFLAGWIVTLINWLGALINMISRLFGGGNVFNRVEGDIAGAADGLATGAGNAGDLADGLDDAGKSAEKLNKSLASFDKMNVLPDKTSSGGGGGKAADAGGGGSNFDPALLGKLDNIFNGIGGKLKEASLWAKIFATFLASVLAVKFAQAIINEVDGIIKSFKLARDGITAFKKALSSGSLTGLAGFLTNPWVLLAIAIIAVIAGLVYLYNTNEKFKEGFNSVWKPIVETLKKVEKIVAVSLVAAFKSLKKAWDDATKPMEQVLKPIGEALKKAGKWVEDLAKKLGLLDSPMKTLGKVIGVVAAVLAVNILAPIIAMVGGIIVAVGALIAILFGLIWVIKKIWHVWQDTWTKVNNITQTAWQAMQSVWDSITGFFVGLWQGIYAIFTAVWTWLQEWGLTVLAVLLWPFTLMLAVIITVVGAVSAAFVWLWNAITTTWSTVYTWFKVNVWDKIVAVFTAAATWFGDKFQAAWDAITAVWTTVSTWFQVNVWDKVVAVFSVVGDWFKGVFQTAWNNITVIFGVLGAFFAQRWENLKANLSTVASWFGSIFQAAWNNITGIFSNLWSWFRDNVWNKITSVFSSIGTTVGDAISGAFKGVINTVLSTLEIMVNGFITSINWAIRTINKLPGVSINEVPKISFPRLASGGIVDQATMAMIGENGAEAVVPLENNTEWLDKLAAKINASGGNGQPIQLTVQIGEERILTKLIDLINEKTQMSGRNTILV